MPPIRSFTSTPSLMSIPASAISKPLRNTAPILPASSFAMLLRNSPMPLSVSRPTTVQFTNRLNNSKSDRPTLFEKTLSELGIQHKLIRPYTPRHNGKVERSHRKDNEEFYASHRFFSFADFSSQLALRQRQYNNFPCVLSTGSPPLLALSRFSSL